MEPIKDSVKYIAELFEITGYDPGYAIADSVFPRTLNIFAFSIALQVIDPANYWIAWGGTFDNYDKGFGIQVFLDLFLREVFLPATLEAVENSFYIDKANYLVYLHIPKNPWQYFDSNSDLYTNYESVMASAPKNEENPSDIIYDGNIRAYVTLDPPSVDNQLNDVISGLKFYNTFSITVNNADGRYDGFDVTRFFETPMQILKTTENAQSLEGFNRIQFGIVNNIKVVMDTMTVEASDVLYLLNKDYCKKFTAEVYPNIAESLINNDIPVAWGPIYDVQLFEVDKDISDPPEWIDYIIIDPDYLTSVQSVSASDGNPLTFFSLDNGIIRVTSLDTEGEVIEADTADVTGKINNSIAEIIIYALENNENLPFAVGVWDIEEVAKYFLIAPHPGFLFNSGTTKELVESVLENDMAFLIQKINGLLTIRQWGQEYETHTIPSWVITQNPEKDFERSHSYYVSTSKVLYMKKHQSGEFGLTELNDSFERSLFDQYKKSYTGSFETDLSEEAEAVDFSERLLERFGTLRETLKSGVGVDTFAINLLDTVIHDVKVNDRQFSKFQRWIVSGTNPGQDTIMIESNQQDALLSFDDDFASIDDKYFSITT